MDALAQTPRPRRVIVGVSGASGAALGLECLRCLRAAGVQMKEQRRLVLMVRETPLSAVHVDNMARLARVPGVMLMPPLLTSSTAPRRWRTWSTTSPARPSGRWAWRSTASAAGTGRPPTRPTSSPGGRAPMR